MNAVSVDVETLVRLPAKTMLEITKQAQNASKNASKMMRTVQKFPDLFRWFEEQDIDVSFNMDYGWIYVKFAGDGERLGKVWHELRRNGYNTSARPKKGDTSFYEFWYHKDDVNPDDNQLYMQFSSTLCKRVKVGTRMVEQDIYETQCGDIQLELPKGDHEVVPL